MTIATAHLRERSIIFLPRLYNGHRDLLSLLQLGNRAKRRTNWETI
ncbi:MAG: hypothetical protein ACKO1I_09105 [Microcystis aeruginosa]|nr:hypothetical protein [Microcystis sp. LE18-22.4A]MCZ8117628.1 hypothetical protein [Microcystis sp. LE18-22.4A]